MAAKEIVYTENARNLILAGVNALAALGLKGPEGAVSNVLGPGGLGSGINESLGGLRGAIAHLAEDAYARLGPDEHALTIESHHIASDGTSLDLAVRELEFSVQMDGGNAGYLYHLGLAYAKIGRIDKSTEALTKALAPGASMGAATAVDSPVRHQGRARAGCRASSGSTRRSRERSGLSASPAGASWSPATAGAPSTGIRTTPGPRSRRRATGASEFSPRR